MVGSWRMSSLAETTMEDVSDVRSAIDFMVGDV